MIDTKLCKVILFKINVRENRMDDPDNIR